MELLEESDTETNMAIVPPVSPQVCFDDKVLVYVVFNYGHAESVFSTYQNALDYIERLIPTSTAVKIAAFTVDSFDTGYSSAIYPKSPVSH